MTIISKTFCSRVPTDYHAILDASTQPFLLFPEPLREGVILARPNRFIMDVDFGTSDEGSAPSGIVRCHCPAVSRIGGLDLAGRPCLVSDSRNPKRKMPLTVEAFSLQRPDDPDKRWIGINQNASNRYVEHFLREGAFAAITGPVRTVRREVPLGDSRLDFLVNDDLYLEVKTPLVQMQTDIPPYVPRLPEAPFTLHRALPAPFARVGRVAGRPRAGRHPLLPLLRQLRVPLLPRHHLRGSARHGGRLPEPPAWSSGRPTSK